jgi:sugar lactone lactonase YvrE
MAIAATPAKMTTIASFPENFFLENLAVRADGSILVSVLNHKQLWHVPAPLSDRAVKPTLVHTFDNFAMGIVEAEPDVFYVSTARQATLERLDLRDWSPGAPVRSTRVLTFDDTTVLNGSCLFEPRVILLADSLGGRIWRVDLADNGFEATSSVWLQHHTMAPDPGNGLVSVLGPQPGINGIHYAERTSSVYYTSTAQKLFMRVPVDPTTFAPVGPPEAVASEIVADDFCIDENAAVAYLTTHTDNTIVCVSIDPGAESPIRSVVAGNPFTTQLVGPSSAAWAREPAAYGRIAYVTTDGGHTAVEYGRPGSDGTIRPAEVLLVEFDGEVGASTS